MSNKVDFKLDLDGLSELMKSPEMQEHLLMAAKLVEGNAKGMAKDKDAIYTSDVVTGNFVAIGRVHAGNTEAMRENYVNNTLVKALGASGLPLSKGGG